MMVFCRRLSWNGFELGVVLTLLAVTYGFMFDFLRWDMFDSHSFVGGARLMFGLEGGFHDQSRLTKPLALVLPGLLEYIVGLPAAYGFLIQGIIAYYVSGFLLYAILLKLTHAPRIAFLGVVSYAMCQPLAIFSFMILTDGLGWMMNLIMIWYCLRMPERGRKAYSWIFLLSLFAASGMLVKESVAFGIVFMGSFILVSGRPQRLCQLGFMGLIIALFFLLLQMITQWVYDDTIAARLIVQQINEGFVYYNPGNIAQLFRVLDFFWLLFFVGVWSMKAWCTKQEMGRVAVAFLLSAALTLLLIPVYPFVVDRILFMVAPALVLFVVMGAQRFGRFDWLVVAVGGVMNILVAWMIYRYNVSGLLLWGGFLYGFIMVALWVVRNHRARVGQKAETGS